MGALIQINAGDQNTARSNDDQPRLRYASERCPVEHAAPHRIFLAHSQLNPARNNCVRTIFLLTDESIGRGVRQSTIGRAMNSAGFHARLGFLGLSVRQFAAMTGVQYETALHWGVARHGHPREFPRWVPLMLEMMDPTVSRYPPNAAMRRPRPRSDNATRHSGGL